MGSIEAGSSEPWLFRMQPFYPHPYYSKGRYKSHRHYRAGGTEPTVLAAFSPSPGRVTRLGGIQLWAEQNSVGCLPACRWCIELYPTRNCLTLYPPTPIYSLPPINRRPGMPSHCFFYCSRPDYCLLFRSERKIIGKASHSRRERLGQREGRLPAYAPTIYRRGQRERMEAPLVVSVPILHHRFISFYSSMDRTSINARLVWFD